MKHKRSFLRRDVALYLSGFLLFLSIVNFKCPPDPPPNDIAVLPVDCATAAQTLTRDWLDANKDSINLPLLRSAQKLSELNLTTDFKDIEQLFTRVGSPNLHQRLVQDVIQADVACHFNRRQTEPAYPDSMLFPIVKQAVLDYLK